MRRLVLLALVGCGTPAERLPDAAPEDGCTTDQRDACFRDGQLCENEACVAPWQYGSPQWSRCEDAPRATPESLAEKARIYADRALALHVHPEMPWVLDVVLEAGTDPEAATHEDVAAWWSSENDGLWSGLVLAAFAYRYAVTGDADARAAVMRLLDGEETRMRITGVPGLFTRQLIPPGITGLACPTDPAMYTPAPDKRGNRWVMIGQDGCAQIVPAGTSTFESTTHCGLDEFRGWCFLDNVSQDEYVGHAFALNAIARAARAQDDDTMWIRVHELSLQIDQHLAGNDNVFVDWDGRQTQWGKLYPGAPGDTRGYLAVVGLGVLSVGLNVGYLDVVAPFFPTREVWKVELDEIDQWEGPDGCEANWNNLSMITAMFHEVLSGLHDYRDYSDYRAAFADALGESPDTTRDIPVQKNAWWNFMWAAKKPLGPGTDGPAYAAVEDAICQLKQFPRSNHQVARDTTVLAPGVCTDRLDNSLAAAPFDIADRCAATFAYWGNPYERHACDDRPDIVRQPGAYLLAYWMGRYYGFIPADL